MTDLESAVNYIITHVGDNFDAKLAALKGELLQCVFIALLPWEVTSQSLACMEEN